MFIDEFVYSCMLYSYEDIVLKWRTFGTITEARIWANKINKKYLGRPRIKDKVTIQRYSYFYISRITNYKSRQEYINQQNDNSYKMGTYE